MLEGCRAQARGSQLSSRELQAEPCSALSLEPLQREDRRLAWLRGGIYPPSCLYLKGELSCSLTHCPGARRLQCVLGVMPVLSLPPPFLPEVLQPGSAAQLGRPAPTPVEETADPFRGWFSPSCSICITK